uniref:Uncharacterized protein n=1 Tax=Anguilla anguilla TaxID=7936 RepID=A0A0E9T5Q1_ANGAN
MYSNSNVPFSFLFQI